MKLTDLRKMNIYELSNIIDTHWSMYSHNMRNYLHGHTSSSIIQQYNANMNKVKVMWRPTSKSIQINLFQFDVNGEPL